MCNMTLNTACMLVLFFSKHLMAKTLFPSYTDYSICRKCCSPLDVTHNLRSPEVTVPSWRTSQDTLMSLAARSVVHCIQCPSPQRITAAQSSLLCMSTHNSGYRHIATVLQCILPLYPSIHSSSQSYAKKHSYYEYFQFRPTWGTLAPRSLDAFFFF